MYYINKVHSNQVTQYAHVVKTFYKRIHFHKPNYHRSIRAVRSNVTPNCSHSIFYSLPKLGDLINITVSKLEQQTNFEPYDSFCIALSYPIIPLHQTSLVIRRPPSLLSRHLQSTFCSFVDTGKRVVVLQQQPQRETEPRESRGIRGRLAKFIQLSLHYHQNRTTKPYNILVHKRRGKANGEPNTSRTSGSSSIKLGAINNPYRLAGFPWVCETMALFVSEAHQLSCKPLAPTHRDTHTHTHTHTHTAAQGTHIGFLLLERAKVSI